MAHETDDTALLLQIRDADTEDLLDRVTAYRKGFENRALRLMEKELYDRGVDALEIRERSEKYLEKCLFDVHGIAKTCSYCDRPATVEQWGWHRWHFGFRGLHLPIGIPVFPCKIRLCEGHQEAIKPLS